jgi:hypothetical protein
MARTKDPPEVVAQREADAWELRRKGFTHEQIAERIGVTRQGVSKILKRVSLRVLKEMHEDVKAAKAEEAAQLNHLVSEAFAAWEKSKAPLDRMTRTYTRGDDGKPVETGAVVVQQDQVGDPSYLDRAMAAMDRLNKLFGMDEASKIDLTSGGKSIFCLEDLQAARKRAREWDDGGTGEGLITDH